MTSVKLSHSTNAELLATYTQPQPDHPQKVLVGPPGIPRQWIIGGKSGEPTRPLRPIADNTQLYVDSNDSLWVQVGDPGETPWCLSENPIPTGIANWCDQVYTIENSVGQGWVLQRGSVGTQVTVARIGPSSFTLAAAEDITDAIHPNLQKYWVCNTGC